MATYPKKAGIQPYQEGPNAPTAPTVAAPRAPQVLSPAGGAPTLNPQPPTLAVSPPYQPAVSPPYIPTAPPTQSVNAMRAAWGMTGTPQAYDRTFQRTVLGSDPGVMAQSLDRFWQGASAGQHGTPLPTPSTMPMAEAQKYLADMSKSLKERLDARLASMPPEEVQRSRFWRNYQLMPEPMSLLAARRHFTNQMVSTGPVADWLQWLKG